MDQHERVVRRRRIGVISFLVVVLAYVAALLVTVDRLGVLGFSWGYAELDWRAEKKHPVRVVVADEARQVLAKNDMIYEIRPLGGASLDDLRRGDQVHILFERSEQRHSTVLTLFSPLRSMPYVAGIVSGLCSLLTFLLVGCYCFYRQPLEPATRLLLNVCASMSISSLLLMTLIFLEFRGIDPPRLTAAFDLLCFLQAFPAFALTTSSMVHLSLVFPRPAPFLRRHPHVPAVVYCLLFVLTFGAVLPRLIHYAYHAVRMVNAVPEMTLGVVLTLLTLLIVQARQLARHGWKRWLGARWASPVASAALILTFVAGGIWFAYVASRGKAAPIETAIDEYAGLALLASMGIVAIAVGIVLFIQFRASAPIQRLQVAWPMGGIVATITSIAVINIALATGGIAIFDRMPEWLAATASLVILACIYALPITFILAVRKYKLWRADSALATAVVIFGALLLNTVVQYAIQEEAEAALGARWGISNDEVKWAIGLIVALVAAILSLVAKWAYKRLRPRPNVQERLPELLRSLSRARSHEELAAAVRANLETGIGSRVTLLLRRPHTDRYEPVGTDAAPLPIGRRNAAKLAFPIVQVAEDDERAFARIVCHAGYSVLAPVRAIDGVAGLIAVAPKPVPFSEEEFSFLVLAADEVADKLQLLALRGGARRPIQPMPEPVME